MFYLVAHTIEIWGARRARPAIRSSEVLLLGPAANIIRLLTRQGLGVIVDTFWGESAVRG
jgi:hypothetical protein